MLSSGIRISLVHSQFHLPINMVCASSRCRQQDVDISSIRSAPDPPVRRCCLAVACRNAQTKIKATTLHRPVKSRETCMLQPALQSSHFFLHLPFNTSASKTCRESSINQRRAAAKPEILRFQLQKGLYSLHWPLYLKVGKRLPESACMTSRWPVYKHFF